MTKKIKMVSPLQFCGHDLKVFSIVCSNAKYHLFSFDFTDVMHLFRGDISNVVYTYAY